jgi:hypothetical protein
MLTSYTKEQKMIDVTINAILTVEVKVTAGNVPLVSYPLITNLYRKQFSVFVRHSEIDYNFNEIFIVQNQLHTLNCFDTRIFCFAITICLCMVVYFIHTRLVYH